MATEELYVNSFDNTWSVGWTKVGISPYLWDTDVDYVYSAIDGSVIGKFDFPNSAGSGIINSVKIRVESKCSIAGSGAEVDVEVWDGTAWRFLGVVGTFAVYTWKDLDATAWLDTWAKINGALVRFTYYEGAPIRTIHVRRCTRKVDYTVAVPPKAGLHPSKPLAIILD